MKLIYFNYGSKKYLFNFNHFGVGFSQTELITAHVYLDRVAQRGNLADEHLNALGNTHVHYAALYRAFAIKLYHPDGFADLGFLFSFFL